MEKCLIQFSKTNNYINECIQCKHFADTISQTPIRIVRGCSFSLQRWDKERVCCPGHIHLWGKWSVPWGALQWQRSPLSVHRGWGGLGRAALTSPPCGSNFRSGIQETAMTATRTETITFSQLPFYCRFTWQLCHLRKSEVSSVLQPFVAETGVISPLEIAGCLGRRSFRHALENTSVLFIVSPCFGKWQRFVLLKAWIYICSERHIKA